MKQNKKRKSKTTKGDGKMKFKAIMRNKNTGKKWKYNIKGRSRNDAERKLFDMGIFVNNDVLKIKER